MKYLHFLFIFEFLDCENRIEEQKFVFRGTSDWNKAITVAASVSRACEYSIILLLFNHCYLCLGVVFFVCEGRIEFLSGCFMQIM